MAIKIPFSPYILPLGDPRATLEIVGGKGASLTRLLAAGLPVPDGFHLTTAAYQCFVTKNEMQSSIQAALEFVDIHEPATLESASMAISGLFTEAQIPPDVTNALSLAYNELADLHPSVAVRSSATAEDLSETSGAGQQDTFLNIQGNNELSVAVKRCWISLWTSRAISYRAQQGFKSDGLSLAVVVQALFPAEVAGILFTANPVTGRRDHVLINGSWGLGKAIVDGVVTPDSLVVDKITGQVLLRETANKQVLTVCIPGGTEEQLVPTAQRRIPVLDDAAAAELTRLGVKIEKIYDIPMDIEWAQTGGEFAILQARPITALPKPAPGD